MSNKLKSLTINLLKNLLIELNDNNINSRNIVNDNINDIDNILKDISNNLSVFYTEIFINDNIDTNKTILHKIHHMINQLKNTIDNITIINNKKKKVDYIRNIILRWDNVYDITKNYSIENISKNHDLRIVIIPIIEISIIDIKKILRL